MYKRVLSYQVLWLRCAHSGNAVDTTVWCAAGRIGEGGRGATPCQSIPGKRLAAGLRVRELRRSWGGVTAAVESLEDGLRGGRGGKRDGGGGASTGAVDG